MHEIIFFSSSPALRLLEPVERNWSKVKSHSIFFKSWVSPHHRCVWVLAFTMLLLLIQKRHYLSEKRGKQSDKGWIGSLLNCFALEFLRDVPEFSAKLPSFDRYDQRKNTRIFFFLRYNRVTIVTGSVCRGQCMTSLWPCEEQRDEKRVREREGWTVRERERGMECSVVSDDLMMNCDGSQRAWNAIMGLIIGQRNGISRCVCVCACMDTKPTACYDSGPCLSIPRVSFQTSACIKHGKLNDVYSVFKQNFHFHCSFN